MKKFFLLGVWIYQKTLSPLLRIILGGECRFYPSCSEYFKGVLIKYKTRKALPLTLQRVLKCHPWNRGGVDLP